MDLRTMKLSETPIETIESLPISEFSIPTDKLPKLEEMLSTFTDCDLWNPVYQAWKPFLSVYLTHGCNPRLTLQYAEKVLQKTTYMVPAEHNLSQIMQNIIWLFGNKGRVLFEGYTYADLVKFSNVQGMIFTEQRKTIEKQLSNPDLHRGVLHDLLALGTLRGMMCAVYLYRNTRCDVQWNSADVTTLKSRVDEWLQTYLQEFDSVAEFLEHNPRYDWYTPQVRAVIERAWTTAFLPASQRGQLLTPAETYTFSALLADKVLSHLNELPCVFSLTHTTLNTFNILANLYFAPDSTKPDFCVDTFFALCLPSKFIKKLADTLRDFAIKIELQSLTEAVYNSMECAYENGTIYDTTPEQFLYSLYVRGFPKIKRRDTDV